jgi:hypothetical protein
LGGKAETRKKKAGHIRKTAREREREIKRIKRRYNQVKTKDRN